MIYAAVATQRLPHKRGSAFDGLNKEVESVPLYCSLARSAKARNDAHPVIWVGDWQVPLRKSCPLVYCSNYQFRILIARETIFDLLLFFQSFFRHFLPVVLLL